MRAPSWWPLVVLLALATHRPAWSRAPNPYLKKGVKLINEMEYDRAERVLKRALSWPGSSARDTAHAHLQLGIVKAHQLDEAAARASFRRALDADPAIGLPEMVSPKIRDLFRQVRAGRTRGPERVEEAPDPPASPVSPPPPSPSDAGEDRTGPEARAWYSNWLAWTALGVAVAAGATGVALGVSSRSEREKAEDPSIPYNAALTHADRSSSRALGANVLFASAGAAAIASGLLFYLAHRRGERSVAVTPAGCGVRVTLRFE